MSNFVKRFLLIISKIAHLLFLKNIQSVNAPVSIRATAVSSVNSMNHKISPPHRIFLQYVQTRIQGKYAHNTL